MSTPRDRRKRDKDVGGKNDGRGSGGGDKTQQRKPSKVETTLPPVDDVNRQTYERTLYMTLNLVGRTVQVQVKSGATYEGIFHTAQTDKGFGVVLWMARKREPGSNVLGAPAPTLIIQGKDFVQMTAKDVTFDDSDVAEDVFMTDTDISGHADARERELQPWVPDGDLNSELSLAGDSRGKSDWDQFAVNEKLFGVKTTYEEELYTTKLDKGSHKYAEQARVAQRIADEIEGKVATNIHLAEERGQVGTDDMDEEERYSSVVRSNVYVPPGKRNQQQASSKDNELNTSSELQEDELRQSAGSPLSPSMTPLSPKDKQYSGAVADRLKLRRALVNETHRTSPTPVHPNNDSVKPHSPLHSPLVGDPKAIAALGLEPRAPAVPEGVAREFLNFSLNKQNPPSSRQTVTADLKQFSQNFGKRPNSPATQDGSAPTSPGPVSPGGSSEAAKPASASAATPATPSTAAPAPPSATGAPTLRPLTSKLNPNAKAFTPMSANAPVFTPKGFVPPHPAPAPIMPPVDHGPVFFHPGGPMQPPHHPHHPPPHLQPAPPMASDHRPLADVYAEGLKRKIQEKSETTPSYWFGTRGSYRTNVEDMDPNLHRPQSFAPPPGAPPMGVMHAIPMGPNLGPNAPHGHPGMQPNQMQMGHNFPPPPYVSVIPNAPMGMVMNMGPPPPMPGGPNQPQVVGGPIFMGQPGMRPYPHPGGPMGMAPGQPPYVGFPPQMTPLSPPPQHSQPQSPSHPPSHPSPQSPTPQQQQQPTSQSPTPQSTPPHPSQPLAQSPTPTHVHSPSPVHAHSPTPAHIGSPASGPKRAFYPHSPHSPHTPHSPQSPHSPATQAKHTQQQPHS